MSTILRAKSPTTTNSSSSSQSSVILKLSSLFQAWFLFQIRILKLVSLLSSISFLICWISCVFAVWNFCLVWVYSNYPSIFRALFSIWRLNSLSNSESQACKTCFIHFFNFIFIFRLSFNLLCFSDSYDRNFTLLQLVMRI